MCLTEKQMDHMLDVERAEVQARGGYFDDDDNIEKSDDFIEMVEEDEFGHTNKQEGRARRDKGPRVST